MMVNLVRSVSEALGHSRPDLWVVVAGTRVDVTISVSKGILPLSSSSSVNLDIGCSDACEIV